MTYTCLNDVRCRMNRIGLKLNEASHYGRRPLPKEFADLAREWDALVDVYQSPTKYPALFKGGVEVVEGTENKPVACNRIDTPPHMNTTR